MKRFLRPMAGVAVVMLLAAGCGEEQKRSSAAPTVAAESEAAESEAAANCDPPRTEIRLVTPPAEAGKPPTFDKSCISAPAGEPFTVRLRNDDFLEHNVAIFADEAATELLWRGDRFRGPKETMTYDVPAIDEPGQYVFLCDVHRTLMRGTLLVD